MEVRSSKSEIRLRDFNCTTSGGSVSISVKRRLTLADVKAFFVDELQNVVDFWIFGVKDWNDTCFWGVDRVDDEGV